MSGRRFQFVVAAILIASVLTGCGETRTSLPKDVAVFLGVAEKAARPTLTADVIIDPSLNSPATMETTAQTIDSVLADVSTRPSPSCIRLWAMGSTVGAARLLAETRVPERDHRPKVQRTAEQSYRTTSRAYLLKAAQQAFSDDPPRRSPLLATLTRIAMAKPRTAERAIYLISDGREEQPAVRKQSGHQFECGALPSTEAFLSTLARERLLEPGLLKSIDITFAFMGFSDPKRPNCDTSPRRELEIQELWRAALERANARSVTFTSTAPEAIQAVRQ